MPETKDPWFVLDRSEALAGILLTGRPDVRVRSERKLDARVDLIVEVGRDEFPSMRLFAVQVKGTLSSEKVEWMSSLRHLFRGEGGMIYTPACVFVVNVRDNQAFYAWLAEPIVEADQRAKLQFVTAPVFHDLTPSAVDDIVERVNAWYDALPAQLVAKQA